MKDGPREELEVGGKGAAAQIDGHAIKDQEGHGDGESEDEQVDPALRTEQVNLGDIPGETKLGRKSKNTGEEEEETESSSDDEGQSDEADAASKHAELQIRWHTAREYATPSLPAPLLCYELHLLSHPLRRVQTYDSSHSMDYESSNYCSALHLHHNHKMWVQH